MKIARIIGAALILMGGVLLVLGVRATQKPAEKVAEGVRGHYTDQTLWFILGGIALVGAGFGVRRIK